MSAATPWHRTCPVLLRHGPGLDDTCNTEMLDAIRYARAMLKDVGDACVATPWTGDHGSTSKPLSHWHHLHGTSLDVRVARTHDICFVVGPRRPRATALLDPAREPPATRAAQMLDVIELHLRRAIERREEAEALVHALREHLRAVEASVRTSGPLPQGLKPGAICAATPWSPLTATPTDEFGNPRRNLLTASQARRWSQDPILICSVTLNTAGLLKTHIGPARTPMLHGRDETDPMADLRAIARLPRRRRGG